MELWSRKPKKQRGAALIELVDSWKGYQEARRKKMLEWLSGYEGRKITTLTASAYYTNQIGLRQSSDRVPLRRALVSTVASKIAGKQRPQAMFCVTDGDWDTTRKAKRKERFVRGVMQQRQDTGLDAWDVHAEAYIDGLIFDCGVVAYYPDYVSRRVVIERVPPWEMGWDPREMERGRPLTWTRRYGYDRFKLAARFPEHKKEIMDAPVATDLFQGDAPSERIVEITDGVRVALGPKEEHWGTHTVALANGLDLTNGDEPWRWTFAPYEVFTWEKHRIGILGTPLVEIGGALADEVNEATERWRKAERAGSNMYAQAEMDSVSKKDLESNRQMTWILRKKGTPPISIQVPNTVGQPTVEWNKRIYQMVYDITGVSQADAQGDREPGLESGEGQRIVASLKAERFALAWKQYETVCSVRAAWQIMRCVDQIMEVEGQNVIVHYVGGGTLKKITAKDVDVELPPEAVQVEAVSGLVNTPADRVELGEKLWNMGVISNDALLRIIQAKDIDRELERTNTQEALIERYIEEWLDFKKNKAFRYDPPEKWLNLPEAIIQVGRAYMQAKLDRAPMEVLKWFVKFLGDADNLVQQIAAKQALLQGASRASGAAAQAIAPQAGGQPPAQQGPVPPQQGMAA